MILPRRAALKRFYDGGNLRHARGFASRREDLVPKTQWVLENNLVKVLFESSSFSGVRLKSILRKNSAYAYTNTSSSLWTLGVYRRYQVGEQAFIHPDQAHFSPPSTTPTSTGTSQKFTFSWIKIPFEPGVNKFINVEYTVTLPDDQEYFDVDVKLEDFGTSGGTQTYSICAVSPLNLALDFGPDPEHETLLVGVDRGLNTVNPKANLVGPRSFAEDRLNSTAGSRARFFNQGYNDSVHLKLHKRGFGCAPGRMGVPMVVFADRLNKQGLLVSAVDTDGWHAKNFQWWSDERRMNIRLWDFSDHEFDAFGVGGKHGVLVRQGPHVFDGRQIHQLGWSVRVHAYSSPTRWADYYGAILFRDTVVPEQESRGWMPKPFWRLAQDGLYPESLANSPFYCITFAHSTGNFDKLLSGLQYFQNVYMQETSLPEPPAVVYHIENAAISSSPSASGYYRTTDTWGFDYDALGTGVAPGLYRSPDLFPVNTEYSGALATGALFSGLYGGTYVLHPFMMSTGSPWTQAHSGFGMGIKNVDGPDIVRNEEDYRQAELSGIAKYVAQATTEAKSLTSKMDTSLFVNEFQACFGVDPVLDKWGDIGSDAAISNVGLYRDTAGLFWKGCYANEHVYWNPISGIPVTGTHPRALYSHYFNDRMRQSYDKFITGLSGSTTTAITPPNQSFPAGDPTEGAGKLFHFGHASSTEYMSDCLLKYSPYCVNTVHIGTNRVDQLTADISSGLLGNAIGGYVAPPPPWSEHVPAWYIAYKDRSVTLNHVASHFSNLVGVDSVYFQLQEKTGVLAGKILLRSGTTGERMEQNLAYITSDLLTDSRITIGMGDSQVLPWRPGLSGMFETQSGWADDPAYSTITTFARQWMRALEAGKEYLLHGRLFQPLESWQTDVEPRIMVEWLRNGPRYSLYDYLSQTDVSGETAVMHSVHRHRENESFLVTCINWTTGNRSFTGRFEPGAYNIGTSYKVYEVGVGTGNIGERSLVDEKFAFTPHIFSQSLTGGQTYLLEFVPSSGLAGLTGSCDLEIDFKSVRYSYGTSSLTIGDAGVSYSYDSVAVTDFRDPQEGFRASSTQSILNNLPTWAKIRSDQESVGWNLVNTWGQMLEELVELSSWQLSNLFLETSDYSLRDRIYSISVGEFDETRTSQNLLRNSSFSIPDTARTRLPMAWTDGDSPGQQALFLDTEKGVLGSNSVKAVSSGSLNQTVELDNRSIEFLTFSLYYLNPSDSQVNLVLSIETIDGTIVSDEVFSTKSSDDWQRLSITLRPSAQCFRAHAVVRANIPSDPLWVGALQLEPSSEPTAWRRSILDDHPRIQGQSILGQLQAFGESGIRTVVHPVLDRGEFASLDLPTRSKRVDQPPKDLEPFGTQVSGRKISFFNEVFTRKWNVQDGKIVERSAENEPDIFARYDIRELRFDSLGRYGTFLEDGAGVTPLSCTVRNGLLFVICQETWRGRTLFTLKCCLARTPPNGEDYLESLTDIELDLPLADEMGFGRVSETVTSMGFSQVDPRWLLVNTSAGRRFFFRMFYDYYHYAPENRKVYFLEEYPAGNIKVT